jgi:hypothetical protein
MAQQLVSELQLLAPVAPNRSSVTQSNRAFEKKMPASMSVGDKVRDSLDT